MLLPILITAVGLFFLFKLRLFFLIHPRLTIKNTCKALGTKAAFRSFSLALAGTLGVGNIVGVAYGISIGGAGTLFWILISALFSSVIKYAESALAEDKKRGKITGMMQVISTSLVRVGKALSLLYSVLCLLLSFVMGAALQSLSVAESASIAFGINPTLFALLFLLALLPVLLFKAGRIDRVASIVIPLATVVYTALCLAVIFKNFDKLPDIITDIFKNIFAPPALVGGGIGAAFIPIREGFARGLLSNEAGAGTSALAESRGDKKHPSEAGLLGMCEVLFDTVILCSLTGFAVLLSGVDLTVGCGMSIVINAFSTVLFSYSAPVLLLLVFLFAYSTVICWFYYGRECLFFILGSRCPSIFLPIYCTAVFVGVHMPYSVLLYISDILLFLMSILTLFVLIKNTERIVTLSVEFGLFKLKKSDNALNSNTAFSDTRE